MELDYVVIGSGPASAAAAVALAESSKKITILDVGTTLDEQRKAVVARMSKTPPQSWSSSDLEVITNRLPASTEPIHSKTSYGSSFSFDRRGNLLPVEWENGNGFNYSLAKGGLSNVWGSSMLPYRDKDLVDWPIRLADLEPYYRKVMQFVPCTRSGDQLENLLPSYSSQENQIRLSKQGSELLEDLNLHSQVLRKVGIHYSQARVAIRAGTTQSHFCQYCKLCLSGCPYALIYSSSQTVDELIRKSKADYRSDHFVEKLESKNGKVVIYGKNLLTDASFSYTANRVYVGAGVLPTARIVLDSLGYYDKPISLKDSQYFIYPILRMRRPIDVENESMHTTSQLFLEIDNPAVSDQLVHIQVYGYSDFLHAELNRTFLRLPLKSKIFRHQFLGRLMIAQGFIHSGHSGDIELMLRQSESGQNFLQARHKRSLETIFTVAKAGLKLLEQSWRIRTIPLLPGLQFPQPGSGYHSGGTFPMRHTPSRIETNTLGELPDLPKVHLIDSSVFPSIAATSITMTTMANAYRIAAQSIINTQP